MRNCAFARGCHFSNGFYSNDICKFSKSRHMARVLTHWCRVTHICVAYLTTIALENNLSPRRRKAIIWINARILLVRPLGTNFNEILIEIHKFPFKKMHLKTSSAKWRPFCLGLNVFNVWIKRSQGSVSHGSTQKQIIATTLYHFIKSNRQQALWKSFLPSLTQWYFTRDIIYQHTVNILLTILSFLGFLSVLILVH